MSELLQEELLLVGTVDPKINGFQRKGASPCRSLGGAVLSLNPCVALY